MGNIKNLIVETLKNYDFIVAPFIFGSFGTEDFMDDSDIDIAILVNENINYMKVLEIEEILEEVLQVKVDLNLIKELSKHIQLEIVMRNECLYVNNDVVFDEYLDELNYWYKTEFPFWLKLMSERGDING